MSKQQTEKKSGNQRKHNPKTRWNNTRRAPTIWGEFTKTTGKGKNKRETVEKIKVPHDKMWDPDLLDIEHLQYPFDLLKLDWMEELIHFALDNKLKLSKTHNESTGVYTYTAADKYGRSVLSISSARNIMYNPKAKKYRGKK